MHVGEPLHGASLPCFIMFVAERGDARRATRDNQFSGKLFHLLTISLAAKQFNSSLMGPNSLLKRVAGI